MLKTLLLIALIVVVLAGAGLWIFWTYFDTYHLATINEGKLYRDGVRSIHQFDLAAKKTHVKTIVSLIDDRETTQSPFVEEQQYCKDHNIELIHIPVTLGGWPDGDQIQKFLAIANDPAKQPVLVHCAQGVRRTGMMTAAYELSVLKFDKQKTINAIQTFGHSDRTVNDVKQFIEVYDPEAQKMTRELSVGNAE